MAVNGSTEAVARKNAAHSSTFPAFDFDFDEENRRQAPPTRRRETVNRDADDAAIDQWAAPARPPMAAGRPCECRSQPTAKGGKHGPRKKIKMAASNRGPTRPFDAPGGVWPLVIGSTLVADMRRRLGPGTRRCRGYRPRSGRLFERARRRAPVRRGERRRARRTRRRGDSWI